MTGRMLGKRVRSPDARRHDRVTALGDVLQDAGDFLPARTGRVTDTPGLKAANPQHYGVSRSDGPRDYSVSFASSAQVRQRMQDQRREGTRPEAALRRALHGRGLRFRLHRKLLPHLRRTADIVFGPSRVAVFVDGCFWHGCPEHYVPPRSNAGYWNPKIERNRERDRETARLLSDAGWLVVRVWEHDDVDTAAESIAKAVRTRHPRHRRRGVHVRVDRRVGDEGP
jgi:DNA mismatch endonuclease (patch repair protein)